MVYYSMLTKEQTGNSQDRGSQGSKRYRMMIVVSILLCGFVLGTYMNVFADTYDGDDLATASIGITDVNVEEEVRLVNVRPGDTLWTIARAHTPRETDVRYYVEQMIQLNELDDHVIYIDQRLRLP